MIPIQDVDLSVFHFIIFTVLLVAFLYQLFFYLRYLTVALRRNKAERKDKISYSENTPPVSVIICAKDATGLLQNFLPEVLNQEYPRFEVVVVNDGANEETEMLLKELKNSYSQLKSTFVPHGTTNISTKKLALTLGIKAASYDWLLFTDADCIPENKFWIRDMARNFVPGVEVVLGYGAYLNQRGLLNRMITYDTLLIALQYLGFAKAGRPYMGVGRNLAYKKEVFHRNNGFVPTLHLKSGDDDLFINRAANGNNTRIECSLNTITWSEPKTSLHAWLYQKERHLSVSSHYSFSSRIALLKEPLSRGLFYVSWLLAVISLILINWWMGVAVAASLFLIRFLVQLIVVNKSSALYSERKYNLDILLFDIYLPLVNLYLVLFGRMGKKARYLPWQ